MAPRSSQISIQVQCSDQSWYMNTHQRELHVHATEEAYLISVPSMQPHMGGRCLHLRFNRSLLCH